MSKNLWLRSLAHRWLGRRERSKLSPLRSAAAMRRRVRPSLETLEDRTVLSGLPPVTTFADSNIAGAGSLRDAIIVANADTGTATDSIQLQAGTYTLSIPNNANNHDVSGAQGDLNITSSSHGLVIQGATDASGKPATIIKQTVADRVFDLVNSGTSVTFKNLIIEGGFAQDAGGAGTPAGTTHAEGGGILDRGGNVTLSNVVLQSNSAAAGAGFSASGGGIYVEGGSLTINSSVIQNNGAIGGNGTSGFPNGDTGEGGGISFDVLTTPLSPPQLIIANSTVAVNNAVGGHGFLSGNSSGGVGAGGGISIGDPNNSGLTAYLDDSTVSGNIASGGDANDTGDGGKGLGGGINFAGSGGDGLHLTNSTITGNSAVGGTGSNEKSGGGGIRFSEGTATLNNVTVADNTARLESGTGTIISGGIWNDSPGTTGTIQLMNTLVANNQGVPDGPDFFGTVSNSSHNLIGNAGGSSGFSAAHGDLLGTRDNPLDPLLGPLANNGGPTQTMALLPGSPAINAGDNGARPITELYDQRGPGFARVVNGTVDIGAFEYQPPSPPAPPPSPAPPPTLHTPPLLAFFDALLHGVETISSNHTESVVDSIFGLPLLISTYDGAGDLMSVTLFGMNVTLLFELL